jgi:lipopolysaccharide transport system ATP-binding protein
MARIRIENVSVDFPLFHGSSRSLKKTVVAAASGRLGHDNRQRRVVQALRDVDIELGSGDRLGLIGTNGAGKTTLLRAIAGIYEPVAGRIRVEGSLNALLEDDVQDFAELGEFLDLPVRFYSTGMMIRLGFAMATAIRPEVLLMDEWFLAGDANFIAKARLRLEAIVRGAEILVLSSHISSAVLEWCNRVIWMDHGRVRLDGPPAEVMAAYLAGTTPAH